MKKGITDLLPPWIGCLHDRLWDGIVRLTRQPGCFRADSGADNQAYIGKGQSRSAAGLWDAAEARVVMEQSIAGAQGILLEGGRTAAGE